MNSWSTTIAGIVSAAGMAVALLPGIPVEWQNVGKVVAAVGTAALGVLSRANHVSDEQAGVNRDKDPKPPEPKPPIL